MEVDPTAQLLVVLVLMFSGSFAASALPYLCSLKDGKLRTLSGIGGGLLIGTVLVVVIPEGFRAIAEVMPQFGGPAWSLTWWMPET